MNTVSGKTQFIDGMRVSREHLEHMQNLLLAAVGQLRASQGTGKICYGFKTVAKDAGTISIGAGLAFDAFGRQLHSALSQDLSVNFSGKPLLRLAAAHRINAGVFFEGTPTTLDDVAVLELRQEAPPWDDGAVLVAELRPGDVEMEVVQKGEWYIPAPDHGHSGTFRMDSAMRWRWDGHAVGLQKPVFDTGFVDVSPGNEITLVHSLGTTELLVQMQARREDGAITNAGMGRDFWYALGTADEITLGKAAKSPADPWQMRAVLWSMTVADPGTAPSRPVADAGSDRQEEYGSAFVLDANRSRAFAGHAIKKYKWTKYT